ncbi:MAG: ubiquitin-activating E1 FCCH domain-containing protein [Devosia sp.]
MRGVIALLKRFHSDESGIFAVIFGVMAIVLVALAGAAVDYTAMETGRARAQIALDSAALGLAEYLYDDDVSEETLVADAQALVRERMANDSTLTINVTDAIKDEENGTLRFIADVTVPMAFVQLVGVNTLTATLISEATKGSINLEVALAIDVTLSMAGEDQIGALEDATQDLIGIVVKEDQDPTYSKMAIIPYSMGVNVGDLANDVRGTPEPYTAITAASWTTSSKTISTATKANPMVITSNAHGFVDNDRVWVSGVSGMTQLNSKIYCVVRVDANKYQLKATSNNGNTCGSVISSTSYSNFSTSSLGTAKKCTINTCQVRVTSNGHGITNDEYVYITNVAGMTQLNNKAWQVESVATNTYVLKDNVAPTSFGTYSSGGRTYCTTNNANEAPCTYFRYTAADNSTVRVPAITTCVTERATNRYSDVGPSTTALGRHYPDGNSLNTCLGNKLIPLTSDDDFLIEQTTGLVAAGSTAGHTGLAWAWYMLSNTFTSDLFDAGSESISANTELEDADPVMKVVVLMTDGLFNTNYCNGVVAKNADSVAGNNAQRINCDGVNSTTQGIELCNQIEADGIIVYTVAFALQEIGNPVERETVRQMLANCATPDGGAYEATDGDELLDAFQDIGKNISDLRLSF